MKDLLRIGEKDFSSRLFIGTGKFGDKNNIPDVIKESESELVTVALRRVDANNKEENILNFIPEKTVLMANTSGARTAQEAVRIARIAREAGCGDFIKIEVINDMKYLMPDNEETIKATKILAKEGFVVMPYMMPDLIAAKKLEEVGAASVMPLGSPIGSNKGIKTFELIKLLIENINIPIIVDAGIGKPSHAAQAMEMGVDAVLINTAIATSIDPVETAKAFAMAVKAGRMAYLLNVSEEKQYAEASSPLTGFLSL